MASTSSTCSILLKTWARETRWDFSWYWTLVWWRSCKHQTRVVEPWELLVGQSYTCTFSTASGKFLLKNPTTSFTPELLFVLTVIM